MKVSKKGVVRKAEGGVVYRKRVRNPHIGTYPAYFGCSFRTGKVVAIWRARDTYTYDGDPQIKLGPTTAKATAYYNSCGAGATVDILVDLASGKRTVTDNEHEPADIDDCA